MVIEVFLDGGFELGEALEDAAANTVLGDPAKETLDLIEPGSRGRGEVHLEAAMPFEPGLDLSVLMGSVVVGNQMDAQRLGCIALDGAQKSEPLLVAVPFHALPDHLSGSDH